MAYKFNPFTSKLDIDTNLQQSDIDHINILNIGTNTHTQIDTHIANNNQAHSDYLKNNADDTTSGKLTMAGFVLTAAGDFAQYKAVAMVADNGATLPSTPVKGQWFLHTPTGRNILYQHDGTNWIPMISVGSMTVYVDGTNGTDSLDKGGATGTGAFKTIQYAVDAIPGMVGGNVVINITSDTYAEDIVIQGKNFTGNYTITLAGTLSLQETVTSATVAAGSGATQGTVTKTGAFTGDSYANLLCYFVTDDTYRLIDSHTNDTLTLVGTAPSSTTQDIKIYDWGTTINGTTTDFTINAGQLGVVIQDIQNTDESFINTWNFSDVTIKRCRASGSVGELARGRGLFIIDTCSFDYSGTGAAMYGSGSPYFYVEKSKIDGSSTGTTGARVISGTFFPANGTIIAGFTNRGVQMESNASSNCYSAAANGYVRVRNCGTGLYAYRGGNVVATSSVQYSGNTVDENGVAASYGYID